MATVIGDYQAATLPTTLYRAFNDMTADVTIASDQNYDPFRSYNWNRSEANLFQDVVNDGGGGADGGGPNPGTTNMDTNPYSPFANTRNDLWSAITTASSLTTTGANDDDELFKDYSEGLLMFASVCCIIFILIGVPGNLITIIALARCKKVRNATAAFIINLSLSDLLFCCFNLPLAASTFYRRSWDHGDTLCRLFPLMRYGLLAVSDFTVLAITINRYVMIGHPRVYQRIYRRWQLGAMVLMIWICAFLSLIPTWRGVWGRFGLDKSIGSCTILPDANGVTPKEFLFVMAFIVPCIFIIVCYARIFYIVRKTAMRSMDPVLTSNSVRILGKSQQSINKDGDRSLLKKLTRHRHAKEETSSSSATSNSGGGGSAGSGSGGYPPPLLTSLQHSQSHKATNGKEGAAQVVPVIRSNLSKLRDDELKFIDTSMESLNPPTLLGGHKRNEMQTNAIATVQEDANEDEVVSTEGSREPNFTAIDITKDAHTKANDDSAYETVTHSLLNSNKSNNVYHITSNGADNCNQLMSIHIEPSSTSGVGDLPLDSPEKNPKKRRFMRKSIKNSLSRMTGRKSIKKASSNFLNSTSAASVLYPGRMSQKDRRLLKMILVIFLSFVICYLPITITKIWKDVTKIHVVNIMGYLLIYLTTCINPIIYVVMSSEYRQAYWNLLLCRSNVPGRGGGGGGRRGSAPLMPSKRKNSKPNIGAVQKT